MDGRDFTLDGCGPTGTSRTQLLWLLTMMRGHGFRPQVAYDIGAHRGVWTRLYKQVFPSCAVVMAEPLSEMAPSLLELTREFPDCRFVECAIGSYDGRARLEVRPDLLEASSLATSGGADPAANGCFREVMLKRLDTLIAEQGGICPEVVKIDAEGSEMAILSAAESLWTKAQLVFLEGCLLNDERGKNNISEEIEFMAAKGFVPFDCTWYMRRRSDGALFLCEVAYVRRDCPARRWA